jgi:hypothetical protein
MKSMRYSLIPVLTGLLLGYAGSAHAQSYSISWYKIAGGGGTSTNSGYSLSGTIGQVDAGTMSGGGYTLNGGFWGIYAAVQTPGSPLLTVLRSGADVLISWPATNTGFVLQETPAMGASPAWSNVGITTNTANGTNTVTVPITSGNLFFRLVNP